jgi:hypothetical protein
MDAMPLTVAAIGAVIYLLGGHHWLAEKTRQLRLENEREERELYRSSDSRSEEST